MGSTWVSSPSGGHWSSSSSSSSSSSRGSGGFVSGFGSTAGVNVSYSSSLSSGSWSYNGSTNTLTVGGGSSHSGGHSSGSSYSSPPPPPPPPGPPSTITKQEQTSVTKLEYVYGIKEIKISGNEIAPSSIYVSKPINIVGNIIQVSLISAEEHPLFTPPQVGINAVSNRCTSVEYYITYAEQPNNNQWHPILPIGQTRIYNELLFFIDSDQATLRFPALISDINVVYADNVKLQDEEWEFGPLGLSVRIINRQPGVDYSIDYTPDKSKVNPHILDFNSIGVTPTNYIGPDGREGEVFNGANHNCSVKLTYTPYIKYDVINSTEGYNAYEFDYKPINVYLENASIAIPNKNVTTSVNPYSIPNAVCTKNMTDYITKETPVLSPYSLKIDAVKNAPENLAFEYYQDSNRLYFTETFTGSNNIENMEINHGDAKIRVKYEYLTSNIRVKIIMRRIGKTYFSSLSPIIHQYTLKLMTLQ